MSYTDFHRPVDISIIRGDIRLQSRRILALINQFDWTRPTPGYTGGIQFVFTAMNNRLFMAKQNKENAKRPEISKRFKVKYSIKQKRLCTIP